MTKIGKLKLFLGERIVSSKLSNQAKMQLLNFIQKEAKDVQLMALAMDGQIIQVSEDAEQIIKDRFKVSPVNEAFTQFTKDYWIGPINRMFGECAKRCGRIVVSTEARLCKQKCQAKRDSAILTAKVKAKQAKMNQKQLTKSKIKVQGR